MTFNSQQDLLAEDWVNRCRKRVMTDREERDRDRAKRTLVAHHANCIDGFTSAWVAARACREAGEVVTLLAMDYNADSINDLMSELCESADGYDKLFIVDYSVKPSVLAAIAEYYPNMQTVMLDHHKTAFERYKPEMKVVKDSYLSWEPHVNVGVILDNDQSGASLCWQYFYQDFCQDTLPMPFLVDYVKDHDLWRFEQGDRTKWVNKFLSVARKTLDNWEDIHRQLEKDPQDILDMGKQLQKEHDWNVAQAVGMHSAIVIQGYRGLATRCKDKKYVSDVGHELAVQSGTFGACYAIHTERNSISWSLRSEGEFDVSAIAKKFGGGGHKNAAGFETVLVPTAPIPMAEETEGDTHD